MLAVATAAVAMDGIDPALLIPAACLLVGVILGTLLGLALSAREVERYRRRADRFAAMLDAAHADHGAFIRKVGGWIDEDEAKAKIRTCTPVEVPE